MGNFEILDHTADIAMRISGTDAADFFHAAFDGFCEITEINSAVLSDNEITHNIALDGADNEELLVRFLNELIRMIQENMTAPVKLLNLEVGNKTLKCDVIAKTIEKLPDGYAEIKAATYHMLKIEHSDDRLIATCILDV
ncbi:archease [bacterium]|nr:archease [bacterium]